MSTLSAYAAMLGGSVLLTGGMLSLGCSAVDAKRLEGPALTLGTEACGGLLAMAFPGLGALDLLICSGAKKLFEEVLAEGQPDPPAAPLLSPSPSGGVAPREALPWTPLVFNGDKVGYLRAPAEVVARMQARLNARVVRAR